MRILLVEDDERLAKRIQQVLVEERHLVEVVGDGQSAILQASSGLFDCLILDVFLPELNGFTVCQRLRQQGAATPILVLTALDAVADKVRGLDTGADDYLTKPFSFDELLARLRALERRKTASLAALTELRVGTLTLHLLRREVHVGEVPIELTVREFALLEYLLRHTQQALTRSQILDAVWPSDSDVNPGIVDTYIHYLRAKLEPFPGAPEVRTIRTIGYMLTRPAALEPSAAPKGAQSQ